jgi:hypothetical protein
MASDRGRWNLIVNHAGYRGSNKFAVHTLGNFQNNFLIIQDLGDTGDYPTARNDLVTLFDAGNQSLMLLLPFLLRSN